MRTNRSIEAMRQEIASCLTQLRLGALTEHLKAQYDNPAFANQCFERRLLDALQQTCAERGGKTFTKLMDAAHLSGDVVNASFDDYWLTPTREKYSSLMDELQTGEWIEAERPLNLVIAGQTGCGKSWIACAMTRKACLLGLKVVYATSTKKVLSQLSDNELLMKRLVKAQLLVFDDFLLSPLTDMEC